MSEPLLEVRHLKKYFTTKKGLLHAVDDVSFSIEEGKTLGLVGESGCGKSTTGRVILRLHEATGGEVLYRGRNILELSPREMREMRRKMQIVFQDPYSSLNPRMSVKSLIEESLLQRSRGMSSAEREQKVLAIMDLVGLERRLAYAFPHELDGGRRQRIGIARALILEPEFVVLDEPVSALDVCIQAQILNLLMDLQKELKLTYLFISHNLSVVKHISDEIAVMYLGKLVEKADHETIFKDPKHPYTKALLSAIPIPDPTLHPERIILEGDVASPINPPPGCRFRTRCRHAMPICGEIAPELMQNGKSIVACHLCNPQSVETARAGGRE